MKDLFGRTLQVGDKVLKASRVGSTARLDLRMVERIEDGRLYLDGAKGSWVSNFALIAKVPSDYPGDPT